MIETTVFGSGSSGNGYLIDDGETQLMIEAGISYNLVAPRLKFQLGQIGGMFITHEHGDHSKFIKQYLERTSFPIYLTRGTARALKLASSYRVQIVQEFDPIKIGDWIITAFPVAHDAAQPVGYVFDNGKTGERLVYVTDTYFVKYHFNHVTHMLVEMNYAQDVAVENDVEGQLNHSLHNRILTSHFEMKSSLEFIEANASTSLQEITLIHVSATNGDPERFKKAVQELTGVPVKIAGR